MPQYLAHGFNLMRQMFDALQALQAQQLIEAAQQAQASMFLVQPEGPRIRRAPPGAEWLGAIVGILLGSLAHPLPGAQRTE